MRKVLIAIVLVALVSGCQFSLFGKPDKIGVTPSDPFATPSSTEADSAGITPKPSGISPTVPTVSLTYLILISCLTGAAIFAAIKAGLGTLVDNIIMAGVGLIVTPIVLQLNDAVWMRKWSLLIVIAAIFVLINLWKLSRRWFTKPANGASSAESRSSALSSSGQSARD